MTNWFIAAVAAYFLGALTAVLDKFLLGSKRISAPIVYAFYMAVFGLFVVFFMPFRFAWISPHEIGVNFLGGAIYIYSLLAIYLAISRSRASQVLPLIGAVTPVAAYFISLFLAREHLGLNELGGVAILIIGGLLISFDLPLKKGQRKLFDGFYFSVLAGILTAAAFSVLQIGYQGGEGFLNGFIWSRFGAMLGAVTFFLHPVWRRQIWASLGNLRHTRKDNLQTGYLFVLNKSLGGAASLLLNLAIVTGSVTLIESLVSLQYVFVMLLAFVFQRFFPAIFQERFLFWDWAQKVVSVALIVGGTFLIFMK